MTTDEFQKVAAIFDAARQMATAARPAYLDQACAGHPGVRGEVESLLAHHDDDSGALTVHGPGEALQAAAIGVLERLRQTPHPGELGAISAENGVAPPTRIGTYTVVRELGAGGMGVVYEARQDNPNRTVALKMIRPGVASAAHFKRFQLEAQVLGELRHPGIAQIYEAGAAETPAGPQPFFAMEFVDGEPLSQYVESAKPVTPGRLSLFLQLCAAVHYAHEKGVIHRDLKPANILVDRNGRPKILDFGVARVAGGELRSTTLYTAAGQLVGTLPYMSPEQVADDAAAIDVRSDVYALGVILFEVLAGRLPYELDGRSVPQAVRTIQEAEPARLSSVSRTFRGDLETIVAKALEKDRERRYQSAAELADDIRRHLTDEPIVARPPSTIYQLRKFAKRHKAVVAGTVAFFLALSAGVIGTSLGLLRATRAERLAQARLQESQRQVRVTEAVNEFLNDDLLSLADPANSPDRDLTLRAAIDKAAERIEERFKTEPLTEAAVRVTLGRAYRQLASFDAAERHLQRAAALREEHLGPSHNDTLKALNHLGILYDGRGRFAEAEAVYRRVLGVRSETLGPEHEDTLAAMNNLGLALKDAGRLDEAEPLLVQAHQTRKRLLPPDHQDLLVAANSLASLYWDRGQYRKALPIYEQTLEARTRGLGPHHPQTLTSMDNLATCLLYLNRYAEAESLTLTMLEGARRVLGVDHPKTIGAMNNLGVVYLKQRQFDRAAPILAEVVAGMRRTRRPGHWMLGSVLSNYGMCLRSMERFEEAEAALLEGQEILEKALGPTHDRTTTVVDHLVTLYETRGDSEHAAQWRERRAAAPPEVGAEKSASGPE